jgi:adenine/guanine phosphoribosyltransferase-like PRPP-binding protein
MHFRSISDLNNCIVASLIKVPRDVDLVVGVPRSGRLPATILALYLTTSPTDFANAQ